MQTCTLCADELMSLLGYPIRYVNIYLIEVSTVKIKLLRGCPLNVSERTTQMLSRNIFRIILHNYYELLKTATLLL